MLRNNSQNKQLHALFGKLGIDAEEKAGLVYNYTSGRTSRSSEMTVDECQSLINQLNFESGSNISEESDKLRKKIISMCHEMSWQLEDGRADMTRINEFCVKTGYLHKALNSYKYRELPKLVHQFKQVYQNFLNAL